jgi:hypothetical protein
MGWLLLLKGMGHQAGMMAQYWILGNSHTHINPTLGSTTFLKSIFPFFPVQVLDNSTEPNHCRIYGALALIEFSSG